VEAGSGQIRGDAISIRPHQHGALEGGEDDVLVVQGKRFDVTALTPIALELS
jgi:hypothetical protein